MPESEFTIRYREGQSFFACEWSSSAPKAVIVLIHGLSDHSGRYRHLGAYFAAAGYAMVIVDLRGHGKSFGKRGHFPTYERVMDDITLFIDAARNRHPQLPMILYGHSMGGNLVLNYLIRKTPAVVASVVTSPWLRLNFKPPLYKLVMAMMINRVFPSMTQKDRIIPSYLSHDKAVAKEYLADPLVHNRISVRTYMEITLAGEYALNHADKVGCPLLLMHGTDDLLTSFSASREFIHKVTAEHTFKTWEGLYHELHNEVGKEAVLGFIKGWMDLVVLKATG
ncbi:MAG: lysophospholipase [Bacteroidetes bacterium]|nr:lysophospholipase [Bacteroidota bacterium]